ncbi:MAG: DNA repair protein RadC [Ignavibacteria bacterium CG22_combo_CG10-13_8_21_14_all_37_15]|nr:MAG: DNA repair protein RadC [Ignavibacteria bacterium CG22_combo_CG10-13_8_21_14_all_37_15]
MTNPKSVKTISWKFRDLQESYPELVDRQMKITSPQDVFVQFSFLFRNEVKEKFVVFWLNSQNRVIGFEVVSEGTLDASVVHPREVFRGAIVATCRNIIIAHNHPSGNLEPSNEDISITKKLVESGKIIEINVFDHIIFTNSGYTSFVEKRLM